MTASVGANASVPAWIYDSALGVYYDSVTNTYAIPNAESGEWSYVPAAQFYGAESSSASKSRAHAEGDARGMMQNDGNPNEKEEGEIEDDVGWGGLMEPDRLEQVLRGQASNKGPSTSSRMGDTVGSRTATEKHPAYTGHTYDDPDLYAFPTAEPVSSTSVSIDTPKHILRLVVQRSNVLNIGQVGIVDAREGGIQLGRDRPNTGADGAGGGRLRLREMEVSKVHCVIYWDTAGDTAVDEKEYGAEAEGRWCIVDLGSTHGTFVYPPGPQSHSHSKSKRVRVRLSEPKHSSKPFLLSHLSQLTIGSTSFSVHIHSAWPCDECQLSGNNEIPLDTGVNHDTENGDLSKSRASVAISNNIQSTAATPIAMDSKQKRENREFKRKREMALLRETLLSRGSSPATGSAGTNSDNDASSRREYVDRSAMRRRLHPPSPPKQETKSSTGPTIITTVTPEPKGSAASSVTTTSFAASFMASQGWQAGQGLGKDNKGRAEPIASEMRTAKRGLGAEGSKAVVDQGEGDWRMRGKQRRWEEMSKR